MIKCQLCNTGIIPAAGPMRRYLDLYIACTGCRLQFKVHRSLVSRCIRCRELLHFLILPILTGSFDRQSIDKFIRLIRRRD